MYKVVCLSAPTLSSLSCKVVPPHISTKLHNLLLSFYHFNEIAKVQWLKHMARNWKVATIGTVLGTKVLLSNEGFLKDEGIVGMKDKKGFFMTDQKKALCVGPFAIHWIIIDIKMAHVG